MPDPGISAVPKVDDRWRGGRRQPTLRRLQLWDGGLQRLPNLELDAGTIQGRGEPTGKAQTAEGPFICPGKKVLFCCSKWRLSYFWILRHPCKNSHLKHSVLFEQTTELMPWQGISAQKFLTLQNGTLEMAGHFVAKIPCHNFDTKFFFLSVQYGTKENGMPKFGRQMNRPTVPKRSHRVSCGFDNQSHSLTNGFFSVLRSPGS